MKKYGCYIANIDHIKFILYGQIDATSMHICTKMKPPVLFTSHVMPNMCINKYSHKISQIPYMAYASEAYKGDKCPYMYHI